MAATASTFVIAPSLEMSAIRMAPGHAEPIGQGRFAKVFRATLKLPSGEMEVAVKQLDQAHVRRERLLASVGIEKLLVRFVLADPRLSSCHNLVRSYGTSKGDGKLLLLFEFCPGGTVQQYRLAIADEATARCAERVAIWGSWTAQLAWALEFLHETLGIVHRDVKPANLLLDAACSALRLADFGSCKVIGRGGVDEQRDASALAQLARTIKTEADQLELAALKDARRLAFVGTLGYLAPELVSSSRVTGAIDVWALGCVVHFLLWGRPPFLGDECASEFMQMRAVLSEPLCLPDIEECNQALCAAACDLITRSLDKSPDTRITIGEVRGHAFAAGQVYHSSNDEPS